MSTFPRLHVWHVRYKVVRGGTLPALPTTALHGALGRAVYDLVCVAKARPSCEGCPAEPHCAYPTLFEPTPGAAGWRAFGVTTEPPRPLALSPEKPFVPTREHPVAVKPGQTITFRLTALGKVWKYWTTLRKALERTGRRGLGERESRARLELAEVVPAPVPSPPADTPGEVTLHFLTPLRLKHAGQIAAQVDASLLFEAIVRRAALLAHLDELSWEPPTNLERAVLQLQSVASLRVVRVGRFSSTQKRWMWWPGVVGTMRLRGASLPQVLPLLQFGAVAQVGKATTFGFGRYELAARQPASVPASSPKPSAG